MTPTSVPITPPSVSRSDVMKGGVHFVSGGIALAMGLYNLMRTQEPDASRRHAVNAVAYLGIVVPWEMVNTFHHWRAE